MKTFKQLTEVSAFDFVKKKLEKEHGKENIITKDNINFGNDKISCISYLIDKYKIKKDPQILIFISFLIELFYNELSIKNNKNLSKYFYNKSKILNQISNMKKFNLDKNNFFTQIQGIIENEA